MLVVVLLVMGAFECSYYNWNYSDRQNQKKKEDVVRARNEDGGQ